MKLTSTSVKLDKQAESLWLHFNGRNKFYVYGAGRLGRNLAHLLKRKSLFSAYIDGDALKQKNGYYGDKVISIDEYVKLKTNNIIIIAASYQNTVEIKNKLESINMREEKDFYLYENFVNEIYPLLVYFKDNELFISLTQIVLTERCTLKCKKCAHACYAVENNTKGMPLEDAMKSADIFFLRVDYVNEFTLLGGEPLLYEHLVEIVEYIGEKYRDKIEIFSITTNGTIFPQSELLQICKKYRVLFRISNYSIQLPRLEEKYKKLVLKLQKEKVDFDLADPDGYWMDYGFEYVDNGEDEKRLISIFDKCKTACREIRKNRFYYCVMARTVADNLKKKIGQNDYLDFDDLDDENYKKQILEYTYGHSEKGYLDMCRYCHGKEASNYKIPIAEQMQDSYIVK